MYGYGEGRSRPAKIFPCKEQSDVLVLVRQLRSPVETGSKIYVEDPSTSSEAPELMMFTSGHRGYGV